MSNEEMVAPPDEVREVFTIADAVGCAPLSLELLTTTPEQHNQRCLTSVEGFGTLKRACNTGLRVYEGARLLAEFIRSSLFADSSIGTALRSNASVAVVELGCGCGLAGMTLAATFKTADVWMTDASEDCVAMVRNSVAHNRVALSGERDRHICSEVLWWEDAAVAELDQRIHAVRQDDSDAARLVLGSDLLYFMVDPLLLLRTCCRIAEARGWIVLAHHMRLADGVRRLRAAARLCRLRVACLTVSTVLQKEMPRVIELGWGSLELLVFRSADALNPADEYTFTEEEDAISLSTELGLVLSAYKPADAADDAAFLNMDLGV